MVAGIPQKPVSFNALHILLGKYRIAGRSSGIPKNMVPAMRFSNEHGIKAHVTTFNSLHDIHKCIDMMQTGASSGRFGIVFE